MRDIRNCSVTFRFRCPESWDNLQATDRADVRFCLECREDVHYCETDAEMIQHAEVGHCVARRMPAVAPLLLTSVGRPELSTDIPREHRNRLVLHRIEAAKSSALEHADSPGRCPVCGFPVANEEKLCGVCLSTESHRRLMSIWDEE